ncbi:uncharacterized protein LOC131042113 [Cryptomeria japonica]|uniref:uncharacterized protein LOC131042113 n=1 Tax=Cryptomeria japonica TaxID=3369 RepID=UPI0025AC4720|nr:uncharacterized protein LOC131042113 [Cryptomeria japonica]
MSREMGLASILSSAGGEAIRQSESLDVRPLPDQNETRDANLFRVMRIVPDRQDYSFVEKVQLPEDEIVGFCNRLVPASASACSGDLPQIRINFDALNQLHLPVVGFYGDKKTMVQVFRKALLIHESVLAKMEEARFEPGFYVTIPQEAAGVLIAFYWHEGEHLKEACRKDMSCNFIRYLVELCQCVHICLGGNYPFEALAASAINTYSKAKRTRKIQVTSVKNSENDLELLPGFKMSIDPEVKTNKFWPVQNAGMAVVTDDSSVIFCEGYYRCCLLTRYYRASTRTSIQTQAVTLKASELGDKLREWSLESTVDYTRVNNKQFISLLECCHPREYEEYWLLKDSFTESAQAMEIKKRCFLKLLPVFCSHVFLFVAGECSGTKGKSSSTNSENTIQSLSHTGTNSFEQFYRELSMILTGENGSQKVLIVGSDIEFSCSDAEHIVSVESLVEGKETPLYIRYGEEVKVNCSAQCCCSTKFNGKAKFVRLTKDKRGFPLSGEKVQIIYSPTSVKACRRPKISKLEAYIRIVSNNSSLSAIRNWVEIMVPNELKNLERNTMFTAFLLTCDQHMALEFMEYHLTTYNTESLPTGFRSMFEKFKIHGHLQPTIDQAALISHDTLRTVCCEVYKSQELKFLQNMEKELSTSVSKQKVNITKKMKDQFKLAEDRFLQQLKEKFSIGSKDNLVTSYIEEVVIIYPSFLSTIFSSEQSHQVELKVCVEKHDFDVVWKAQEVIPTKKEMNELISNPTHPIVPIWGQPFELVAIDPKIRSLFKVVLFKSGESVVFIHNFKDSYLELFHCARLGSHLIEIRTFKRGFDMLSIDEASRAVAFYDRDNFKIAIYKFDDSFKKIYPTGVEVNLDKYKGSKIITWMHLIPGKMELLLVDVTNRARVVEIHQKPVMKPKFFSLSPSLSLTKACITLDGFFFIVFSEFQSSGNGETVPEIQGSRQGLILEIFVLGDTLSHLKTMEIKGDESCMCNSEQYGVKLTSFGPQSHLVLYNYIDSSHLLTSHVLKSVLAMEAVRYTPELEPEAEESAGQFPYLGYIYHIFDKFPTTPTLIPALKDITFKVILESSIDANGEACIKYLELLIRQLKQRREKDFSNFKIQFQVEDTEICSTSTGFGRWHSLPLKDNSKMKMGVWVRKLVCLVPIQIARAEKNGMVALKDGLQIPPDISYTGSVSLANQLRFGFYDAVLNSWKGQIKVISSMGKQSSGKSYLLNHLSGSLLDVAGGRCTDGVWMTLIASDGGDVPGDSRCLYVLLDFEGLGSFERSEQEDMLLSVLNAAISNITIFNKKDFHLDKETETSFSRFQSGINLLEQDNKLFKGLFYIAIKDVDASDVHDLIQEFNEKIFQICTKSPENFILKMYGGKVEIDAMAPYNRSEYYQHSLSELAQNVHKIDHCYDNGSAFTRDLKLIISQIAAKDWSPVDSKRVGIIVEIIKRNLKPAVSMGCLCAANTNEVQKLVNFDTEEEVPDLPLVVDDFSFNISDSDLYLTHTKNGIRHVLSQLRSTVESILPREGNNADSWHSMFEKFLEAIGERRRERVQQWISTNTRDFCKSEDVQKLQLEASLALGEVKQGLSVCGCKCSKCYWRCVFEKGHSQDHSCEGSHSCTEICTYCVREGNNSNLCKDLAGHQGHHHCKERTHTCREPCHLYNLSSNCNEFCSQEPEHEGPHSCNSLRHMCKVSCSLESCNNTCIVPIETIHRRHRCHERYCQSKCIMKGCTRTCGEEDHFHKGEHLCGNEHTCPENCEMPGICEVFTQLVRKSCNFKGQRGSFEYEHFSEQNGQRKGCCILIPPFKRTHRGPHVHTNNASAVHYCDTKCEACGYFCRLPLGHPGLHKTVHGNMRNTRFISEEEDINIGDRKYKWGEKGEAEMCNMFCRKQGRGHIHLVPCPKTSNQRYIMCTSNLHDGSRHATVKYGPDIDVPKDEMTHETYWKYVRFVDPCTEEERQEFNRCNHQCKSEEHNGDSGENSYCTEQLWHKPIERTRQNVSSTTYVTVDGHRFACRHSANVPHHVIFVIDISGSMGSDDISPTMEMFDEHNSRLGCVYEAILTFIGIRLTTVPDDSVSVVLFNRSPTIAVEMQDMEESVVESLLQYAPSGSTNFSSGLECAEKILIKAQGDPILNMKIPVVIFLSDGGNNARRNPVDCVESMKRQESRMTLHTIMFGNDPTKSILEEMAMMGDGQFQLTLDALELSRSFENLAKSLRPPVASLM